LVANKEANPSKEGIVVSGEAALRVAEALTATTMKMLQLLWQEPLDVSTIGRKLRLSQAYISEQVKLLEELKLLNVTYAPGKRGIRKICSPAVEQVTLIIKEKCTTTDFSKSPH
jgi:predicted transcriptional regulator